MAIIVRGTTIVRGRVTAGRLVSCYIFFIGYAFIQEGHTHIKSSPPALVLFSLHTGYSITDEDMGFIELWRSGVDV